MDKPSNCSECGKPINADNPETAGGGDLDYAGVWTTWTVGKCCWKPITSAEIQDCMNKLWAASK